MADKKQNNYPNVTIKQYREAKKRLKMIEADNFDKIIAIPCDGNNGWYDIAEHSALFYYYGVCRELNLKAKFFADAQSYYYQYEIGYMRSKGVDNIRHNLEKLGLLESETTEGNMYIFKLKKRYTRKEVKNLKAAEHKRRTKNATPVEAKNLDPIMYSALASSSRRLHKLCNSRLDRLSSQINGRRILELVDGLIKEYRHLTLLPRTTYARREKILNKMRVDSYDLIIEIQILSEARLWDFELCSSVMEPLLIIRDQVEYQLRRVLREKARHNNAGNQSAKQVAN